MNAAKEIFDKLFEEQEEIFNIVISKYKNYKNKIIESKLTVLKWYKGIVNNKKDLLSPPEGMEDMPEGMLENYSMGAYDIDVKDFALVEVRCYNRYKNYIEIIEFLKKNTAWFFEKGF